MYKNYVLVHEIGKELNQKGLYREAWKLFQRKMGKK